MPEESNPTLTGPADGLAVARAAGANRFICQGDRVIVCLDDRVGVLSVEADGIPFVEDLLTDFGPCGNVLSTPGNARRELLSAQGVMLEDVFVLPRLPGAVLQWVPPDRRAFSASLKWACPVGTDPTRSGSTLRLSPAGEGGTYTTFRVEPEPEEWSFEHRDGKWEIRAKVNIPAGEALSWIAGSAARPTVADATVATLDKLGPQEAVQGGWLRELAEQHLRTRTGVHEIDSALEWAKARASGYDAASLPRLLAQLGSGLLREAKLTLDKLADERSPDFGHGLGEYLMWTGDYGAPAGYLSHLHSWLEMLSASHWTGPLPPHGRLADALDGLGYPDESDAVKRLDSQVGGGAPIVLPMAGQPQSASPRTDPDSAWLHFRGLTAACSSGAIRSKEEGALDPGYELVVVLLDNLLHVRGEASLGRLALSPALPEHLTSFQVEGIRVGNGGIDFRMDREGDRTRYLFQPTSGAMPLNLIFEPSLPGIELEEALIDGAIAELDWVERGKRITPRLQFPVDRERTVEFSVKRSESD